MNSPAQDWLAKRGCAEHVVKGGVEGLLRSWELTARELAENWNVDLDDYLNDLDDRQILEEMSKEKFLDEHDLKRVGLADHLFKGSTQDSAECVWGGANASEKKWNKETNWWYWRKPLD